MPCSSSIKTASDELPHPTSGRHRSSSPECQWYPETVGNTRGSPRWLGVAKESSVLSSISEACLLSHRLSITYLYGQFISERSMNSAQSLPVTRFGSDSLFSRTECLTSMMRATSLCTARRMPIFAISLSDVARSLVTIVLDRVGYISGTGFEGGALWQAQDQGADEDMTSTSAQIAEA